MAETIDYFYSHISPWAYLGHAAFMDMAVRTGVDVRFRPVNLGEVFPETGGLPLGQRHPKRQEYRWHELQRWVEKRKIPLVYKPAHFPTNPALVDNVAIALAERGVNPGGFSGLIMAACWAGEKNIADEAVVRDALTEIGQDADSVLKAAASDAVAAQYTANVRDAIEIPAFGSPCYVRDAEPFWGQDRIDLLEDAIVSGRAAFRPL